MRIVEQGAEKEQALDAIAAGAETVLVAGVEIQTTQSARVGADYLARASHYRRQRSIDEFTFPALFAARIKACRERWGITDEDLGYIATKAYSNANKNPYAHMRTKEMPLELASSVSDRSRSSSPLPLSSASVCETPR